MRLRRTLAGAVLVATLGAMLVGPAASARQAAPRRSSSIPVPTRNAPGFGLIGGGHGARRYWLVYRDVHTGRSYSVTVTLPGWPLRRIRWGLPLLPEPVIRHHAAHGRVVITGDLSASERAQVRAGLSRLSRPAFLAFAANTHVTVGSPRGVPGQTQPASLYYPISAGHDNTSYWITYRQSRTGEQYSMVAPVPYGLPVGFAALPPGPKPTGSALPGPNPSGVTLYGVLPARDITSVREGIVVLSDRAFVALAAATSRSLARNLDPGNLPTTDGSTTLVASFKGSLDSTVFYNLDVDLGSLGHAVGSFLYGSLQPFEAPNGDVVVVAYGEPGSESAVMSADGQTVAAGPVVYDGRAPGIRIFAAAVPKNTATASLVFNTGRQFRFNPAALLASYS